MVFNYFTAFAKKGWPDRAENRLRPLGIAPNPRCAGGRALEGTTTPSPQHDIKGVDE
jgi:hypothetical protein